MLTTALQTIVQRVSGLHLSAPTVSRAAQRRMDAIAVTGLASYIARIQADPGEMAELIELLVVPETWLFRDPEAFVAAAQFAVRRQAEVDRPLRILSLPCATGEEPYSLAMAMLDTGMTPGQFTIQAVDISTAALARAQVAVYRQNAFRNEDRRFQLRYFTTTPQGAALDPGVRALVRFSQGNLLAMPTSLRTQSFDIIFCRNLLIYFDEPTQRRAIAVLDGLLDDGGLLFTGYAELPVFTSQRFDAARLPRAFALRKKAAGTVVGLPMPASCKSLPASAPPPATKKARTAPSAELKSTACVRTDAAHSLLDDARKLTDQAQFPAAVSALERYLSQVPDCAEAYALLGAIHASRGATAEADQCLRKALYLDPNRYEVLCQLAILAEQQGDAAAARTLRSRAARVFAREQAADAKSRPAVAGDAQ